MCSISILIIRQPPNSLLFEFEPKGGLKFRGLSLAIEREMGLLKALTIWVIANPLFGIQIADPCRQIGLLAESISETGRARLPEEFPSIGHTVQTGEPLKSLEDGIYIYLISRDAAGNITLTYHLRDPIGPAQTPFILATHRGLRLQAEIQSGKLQDTIGAGQFFIVNGKVFRVDNQSGSFRGGANSLDHSTQVMTRLGLAVEPHTEKVDISSLPLDIFGDRTNPEHADALEKAKWKKAHQADPELVAMGTELKAYHRRLSDRYRKETTPPGAVESFLVFQALLKAGATPDEAQFLSLYIRWIQNEGVDYSLHKIQEEPNFRASYVRYKVLLDKILEN